MTDESRAKPVVWFLDTSALITLAVHPPLQAAVSAMLTRHHRILAIAIVNELNDLASRRDDTARWAKIALGQLTWLGQPVPIDVPAGTQLARRFQQEIADERPLRHRLEHYGEAVIVALACRAKRLAPHLLSDDFGARALAIRNNITSLSVHRLLHTMITAGDLRDTEAAEFAAVLHKAGRAPDFTIEELRTGRLGRVGRPR